MIFTGRINRQRALGIFFKLRHQALINGKSIDHKKSVVRGGVQVQSGIWLFDAE